MFKKVIEVQNKNSVAMGSTTVSREKTVEQIRALLIKHGAERIATDWTDDDRERIGFQFGGARYWLEIPKVIINGTYNDKVGPRLIFHWLKSQIELTKDRGAVADLDDILLPIRMVKDQDGNPESLANLIKPLLDSGQPLLQSKTTHDKNFLILDEEGQR